MQQQSIRASAWAYYTQLQPKEKMTLRNWRSATRVRLDNGRTPDASRLFLTARVPPHLTRRGKKVVRDPLIGQRSLARMGASFAPSARLYCSGTIRGFVLPRWQV
jgi:hypothetical protein